MIKDAAPGPGFLWNPVVYSTTTAVEIDGTTVSGSYATFSIVSRIYPFTFAVNDTIDIYFEAPIVEYA